MDYEIRKQKFVLYDDYEGTECLGHYTTMNEAVKAGCKRYHDTDGECSLNIVRLTSENVIGWYLPVCPSEWTVTRENRQGDYTPIEVCQTKDDAIETLIRYCEDSGVKTDRFFVCGPDATLYDVYGNEVQ